MHQLGKPCKAILRPDTPEKQPRFEAGELRSARPERECMDQLSATAAGAIMARGRKLLRRGQVTHRQLALLDCLLWSCRRPGQAWARVSYTRMSALARISRETVAGAIKRLVGLGLIQKQKERVLVAWGGSTASRQGTSRYRLIAAAPTEFAPATVNQGLDMLTFTCEPSCETKAAQQALAATRERRLATMSKL